MKRAWMGVALAAVLLCTACSDSKPAPAAGAVGKAAGDAKDAAAGAPAAAAVASASFNMNCPIMGDEVDPKAGTAQYAGHTIGFCCPKCPAKFAALDDKGKVAALAKHGAVLK